MPIANFSQLMFNLLIIRDFGIEILIICFSLVNNRVALHSLKVEKRNPDIKVNTGIIIYSTIKKLLLYSTHIIVDHSPEFQ